MNTKIAFPAMVKEYRLANNLTMEQLAEKIGKTKSTISKWESGTRSPKIYEIEEIAIFFGVHPEVMMFGESSTTSPDAKNGTVQAINDKVVQLHPERQENVLGYATEQLEEQIKGNAEIGEEIAEYKTEKVIPLPQNEEFESLVVHGLESAGEGIWQENDVDIEIRIPISQIPDKFDDLAMVIGDSMRPKLHNGDILFVTFTKQIEIGQIGVFRTSKGNFVKKLQPDRLESLNPNYDDIYFNEYEFAEAIGVVEHIYRK
ncbi:XRE family transcriptional regulator [Streptococcus respiraculi]|uniref:XRE family transcriptional regulator n=1 Tax=Streptococcus respiraculi TaxID=2021971 RepID=UPI000E726D32|nr:LexA family transcriptional regulator [Streptococcus respiraculi]